MAEVIDNKVSTWSLDDLVCTDCKSMIKIIASDVYTERLGSFDEFETYYTVECPACKAGINVAKKVPAWVLRHAKPKAT